MADFKEIGNILVMRHLFIISQSMVISMQAACLVNFMVFTVFEHSHTVTGARNIEAGY